MPDFQQVASSVQQELMSVVNQLADLRGLKGAWALAQRELVRFVRQRNRITGALLQPLIFWILFGAGLGPSFKPAAVYRYKRFRHQRSISEGRRQYRMPPRLIQPMDRQPAIRKSRIRAWCTMLTSSFPACWR